MFVLDSTPAQTQLGARLQVVQAASAPLLYSACRRQTAPTAGAALHEQYQYGTRQVALGRFLDAA